MSAFDTIREAREMTERTWAPDGVGLYAWRVVLRPLLRQLLAALAEVEAERDDLDAKARGNYSAAEGYAKRAEKAEAMVARQGEALREARKRLRVNAVAWHTKFHERRVDFEDCDVTSCTNDQDVLGQIDAALAGSDVPPSHVCADHTVTADEGASYCAGCERDAARTDG